MAPFTPKKSIRTVSVVSWPMLGICSSSLASRRQPRSRSRARRRTSTTAEALGSKRLPRRQRLGRREGRGLERALASTRHGQSLRRKPLTSATFVSHKGEAPDTPNHACGHRLRCDRVALGERQAQTPFQQGLACTASAGCLPAISASSGRRRARSAGRGE
jgi:hypothetical protein